MQRMIMPVGLYETIVSEIGRWKIMSLKELYLNLSHQVGYKGLAKHVLKLERLGFLSSFFVSDNSKFVYLTDKGASFTSGGVSYQSSEENFNHDLKCSIVLRELLKYKNFKEGQLLDDRSDGMSPDACLRGIKRETHYLLAIEIEINQKSKIRIREKFKKYNSSEQYPYVLYVFQKKETMNAYKDVLVQMQEDIKNKIILMVEPTLNQNKFDYNQAICFFKGEQRSFESIFG